MAFLRGREVQRKCVIVMTAADTRETRDLDHTLIHRVLHKPFDIVDVLLAASECVAQSTPRETNSGDI